MVKCGFSTSDLALPMNFTCECGFYRKFHKWLLTDFTYNKNS